MKNFNLSKEKIKNILDIVATTSGCCKKKVAALILHDGTNEISVGSNITVGKVSRCEFHFQSIYDKTEWLRPMHNLEGKHLNDFSTWITQGKGRELHREWSKENELHAEIVAIDGKKHVGSDMYITLEPCINCAKAILQAGIKKVWFFERFEKNSGLGFLISNDIKVEYLGE